MDRSPAEKALLALAKEDAGRTKTARLREMLDTIEATKRAGVSNARIVETLNAQGFDLTLKTFETTLYRIRKKQTKQTPAALGHDQKVTSANSTTEARKVGSFEIPTPKRFTHNPVPDDDQLT